MSKKHDLNEIDVMNSFAEVCPLSIQKESIKKMKPPQPDIYCVTIEGEKIAFELVDLTNPAINKWHSDICKAKELFRLEYNRRTAGSPGLSGRLCGTTISIWPFSRSLRNEGNISMFFDWLQSLPDPFPEEIIPDNAARVSELVKRVKIKFLGSCEPVFQFCPSGPMHDPIEKEIRKKCCSSEKYISDYPMELLAYYRHSTHYKLDAQPLRVAQLIRELGIESEFRRIWIYDYSEKRILHVWPEL